MRVAVPVLRALVDATIPGLILQLGPDRAIVGVAVVLKAQRPVAPTGALDDSGHALNATPERHDARKQPLREGPRDRPVRVEAGPAGVVRDALVDVVAAG